MRSKEETVRRVFERRDAAFNASAKKRASIMKAVSFLMCFLVVAVCAGTAFFIGTNDASGYRILIDVNPSIAVEVDGGEVSGVEALNEDAEKIVGDTDFSHSSPEEAVSVITERLADNGYLSDEANSMLVSVESDDEELAGKVGESVTNAVLSALSAQNVEGALVVQTISPDDEKLSQTAEEFGISPGKAQLISQIIEHNSFLTFDELSGMTIQQLNVLRVSYYIEAGKATGEVSLYSYIGEAEAKRIAFADCGVSENDASEVSAALDCRNGSIIYLVEFESGLDAYRYRINAVTAEIITSEKTDAEKKAFFEGDAPVAYIGENAALMAACEHAGVENGALIRCKIQRDWVGKVIYKISFGNGLASYNYTVDAVNGDILQYSNTAEHTDRSIKESVIGESAARKAVVLRAGLIDGNISKYKMTLSAGDGSFAYAIEFICDGCRYTAAVDAKTGEVTSYGKEILTETGAPSEHPDSPDGTYSEKKDA